MNKELLLPSAIFNHWIHSHEEDTEDVRVYRPSDYKFPPARGRDGFEIVENGEFIQYSIGPTDRQQRIVGTWRTTEENQINISFESPIPKPYTMQIISCDEKLLKVSLFSN